MRFSKKILALAFLFGAAIAGPVVCSADDNPVFKGETDGKGNVAFTMVLEGLPLNQNEVLNAAKDYLANEYRTVKYKDIKEFEDKGLVYATGNLNAFYTENQLAGSKVYSTDFYLRFDCKDNRARIQMIAKDYSVKEFSDIQGTETTQFVIAEQPPFAEGKKGFKKAYAEMEKLANTILKSASNHLKSTTPAPATENW